MAVHAAAFLPRRKTFAQHAYPALAALAVFLSGIFVLDPRPPFTLSDGFVEQPVHAGDTLRVDWVQDWRRLCVAESSRSIVRADKKIDTYEKAILQPPAKTGKMQAIGTAVLSKITPPGPAVYRATVTFPVQFSRTCILLWPISFTTSDVPFVVAKGE